MPHYRSLLLVLAAAAGLLLFPSCNTTTEVMANGWADENYLRGVPAGGEAPDTFVFYKGHRQGGRAGDKSLDQVAFRTICEALRPSLVQQGFRWALSIETASLVLVVHWGETEIQWDDIPVDVAVPSGDGDVTYETQYFEQQSSYSRLRNAKLLGLKEIGSLPRFDFVREKILESLEEERYYVLVVAYEIDRILDRSLGDPMVWVARLSVPSRGTNFHEALPAMARMAAPYLGTNASTGFSDTHLGEGEVTFEDLQEVPADQIPTETGAPAPAPSEIMPAPPPASATPPPSASATPPPTAPLAPPATPVPPGS